MMMRLAALSDKFLLKVVFSFDRLIQILAAGYNVILHNIASHCGMSNSMTFYEIQMCEPWCPTFCGR